MKWTSVGYAYCASSARASPVTSGHSREGFRAGRASTGFTTDQRDLTVGHRIPLLPRGRSLSLPAVRSKLYPEERRPARPHHGDRPAGPSYSLCGGITCPFGENSSRRLGGRLWVTGCGGCGCGSGLGCGLFDIGYLSRL